MESQKEYTNGEITVVWKQHLCIHSGNCVRGLPTVFRPKVQPWIEVRGASSEEMINQIKQCPSGALSFYYNKDKHA
ncbi:(4Fe-4S)-binding protein [Flavobacterium suncheonense]|uniref:Divergent 4Fe-4S mono-cluster n=1 Tax=Flavobacterium suncheonense GH29-5 = DSM 17707 TaxID=1121899 RepID=A0A0A2MAY1_9FLAO|nr:(4Fe-4S)-binding protein [Flavobacterium suncheonense]KGO89822.1 divergent 4Fe-4S mono-cluster [Flavobacterium suncheonense GH29-5 = DSM 17707]